MYFFNEYDFLYYDPIMYFYYYPSDYWTYTPYYDDLTYWVDTWIDTLLYYPYYDTLYSSIWYPIDYSLFYLTYPLDNLFAIEEYNQSSSIEDPFSIEINGVNELSIDDIIRNIDKYLPDWIYDEIPSLKRALKYWNYIYEAAQYYNVDPIYILSVILQESKGNPRAVSRVGAVGLMQVLPSTAKWLSDIGYCPFRIRSEYDAKRKLYNPYYNIYCGTAYIKYLIDRLGYFDPELIAIGYNAGHGRMIKYAMGVSYYLPRETVGYKQKVTYYYNKLYDALNEALGNYI